MTTRNKNVVLAFFALALLFLATNARTTPNPENTLLGAFPAAGDSAYACNVAVSTWMIEGIKSVQTALLQRMNAGRLTPAELDQLRTSAAADAARIADPNGPARELALQIERATRQLPDSERVVLTAPDPRARQAAELSLQALRKEIALLERARQQVSIYAKRLEELATTTESWLAFWKVTESAQGAVQTRKQVIDLLAKEASRWNALYRHEIASVILARDHRIPDGLPQSLQEPFRTMSEQLPRFRADVQLSPNPIHPMIEASWTGGVSIVVETTRAASPTVRITAPDGSTETVVVREDGPRRYRASWHPSFLSDAIWRKQLGANSRAELGNWHMTVQLKSAPEATGGELVTATTSVLFGVAVEAPLGIALESAPRKSRFLQKYPGEADIPMENKHHILSILAYPFVGLPRDLIDAAFGAVDKIPYIALPINLVYAGPGQLLCKPWWDDEYRPFAQQSAGFYPWTGGDQDQWQYFENARTWYWPKSEDAALLSFVFYLGLGLPRDLLDVPFGLIDQIPVVSTPISHVYAPLTVATKPWYAKRYNSGDMKGRERVPYCEQSKSVTCMDSWWDQSRWVFFENYKTTTFRSPNTKKHARLLERHRKEMDAYRESAGLVEERNNRVRSACIVTLGSPSHTTRSDTPVKR